MSRVLREKYDAILSNRFELIVLAVHRARAIASGNSFASSNRKKEVVVALDEIADKKVSVDLLRASFKESFSNSSGFLFHKSKGKVDSDFEAGSDKELVSPSIELDVGIFSDQNIDDYAE